MKVRRSKRILFEEQRDTFTASKWRGAKGNKDGRHFEDSFKRILPVVLYGCEAWSLTAKEERKLRVFENMVLW